MSTGRNPSWGPRNKRFLNLLGIIFPSGTLTDYQEYPTTAATPVSGSGAFTSVAGSVQYTRAGNRVGYTVVVVITTNGTAGTYVEVPLPFTASTAAISGFNATNGVSFGGVVTGAVCRMYSVAGGYPGADGFTLVASGTCEV